MNKSRSSSPLKIIESKPYRKSRSETLLRLLISSSYPHALASNLAIGYAKSYEMDSEGSLIETARELRGIERGLSVLDFIRCIEIIKTKDLLTIDVKRMANIDSLTRITDNAKNHESILTINLNPLEGTPDETLVSTVAEMFLQSFYLSQAIGPDKQKDYKLAKWEIATRRQSPGEPPYKTKPLRHPVDYDTLVNILVEVLTDTYDYHILLTQSAILVKDRGLRITLPR